MFKKAIKDSLNYVRPLITGKVFYNNPNIINSINSLMVVNKNGDIITTLHNAELFLIENETNETFIPIIEEIKNSKESKRKKIEEKYGINNNTIICIHNMLIDVAKNPGNISIIRHPYLDLALIKMENASDLYVKNFPKFKISEINQGESVCNIGFAFPEFKAFKYDKEENKIITTNEVMNFPIFPLNGMITRNILDEKNNLSMFEVSAEVIPGQGGGPVIDANGFIIGMLFGTKVISDNNHLNIKLGMAINSKTITDFLKENNIEFEEII